MPGLWRALYALAAVLLGTAVQAGSAYLPASDDEVLETLPKQFVQSRGQLQSLKQQQANNPNNPQLALQIAKRYRQLGDNDGDPRYYGYARAALAPWWNEELAPLPIMQLRAKLKEKNHQYAEARSDLTTVLRFQPRNQQAWIDLANIARVQGDYSESSKACQQLAAFADAVPTAICQIPLQLMTGEAKAAFNQISTLIPTLERNWKTVVPWSRAVQAEAALALGDSPSAEQSFRAGLLVAPSNSYLLRGIGELLLEQERHTEILELLTPHTADNGILLLVSIAAHRSGKQQGSVNWEKTLRDRFKALRLRGDQPHGRFESRFLLDLANKPNDALNVALANWQQQKEIADARAVLRAAIAVNMPAAAEPVISFLKSNNTEHAGLTFLAKQLGYDL